MKFKLQSNLRQRTYVLALSVTLVLLSVGPLASAYGQSLDLERGRGRDMLRNIKDEIKKNYYDPEFHGMNLDERFKQAEEKMAQAQSPGQIFGIIAQVMIEFNDSHLYFIPPARTNSTEYGWQWQAIGDKCFVTAVKPGSDAEAKGLKPGDQVLAIDSYTPARENAWKLDYLYNTLRPQAGMRVAIKSPDGKQRQLDILAKVKTGKRLVDLTNGSDLWDEVRKAENEDRLNRHRYYEIGEDLMIWKMPQFDLTDAGVDDMMDKAKKHKALILDLRGNGGGYEKTLQRLLGNLFDHEVKIGDIKRRKENKSVVAKARGSNPFSGKIIVLIDSKSGSAAELFARMIQIEKRGTVIGDQSAGAVMRAKGYSFEHGTDRVVFYGASITDADIIMTDGKSLEHTGVTPDELLLPTGAELAAGQDRVLARAAEIAGIKIEPEKAGAIFPIEWRK